MSIDDEGSLRMTKGAIPTMQKGVWELFGVLVART